MPTIVSVQRDVGVARVANRVDVSMKASEDDGACECDVDVVPPTLTIDNATDEISTTVIMAVV